MSSPESMFRKMKDMLGDVKDSLNENKSISKGILRLKDASSNGVQRATYHTSRALGTFMIKFPSFMIFLYAILFHIGPIYFKLSEYIVRFFQILPKIEINGVQLLKWVKIPDFGLVWLPSIIIIMLFILIIVVLWPSREPNPEWKRATYGLFSTIFISFMAILIIVGQIVAPSDSLAEGLQTIKTVGTEKKTTLYEDFMCSINPTCIQQRLNEKESENIRTQDFSIEIVKPNTLSYSFERLKNQKLYFKYDILSKNSAIKLEKLECYANSDKKESNRYWTLDLSNKGDIDNENKVTESGFYCDQNNLTIDDFDSKDVKLFPVLYYSVVTTLSQEIPFQKVNSVEEMQDLRDSLVLDKGKTSSSNDLLKLTVQTSNFDLPIFHGDGVYMEEEYIFDFKIKPNNLYTLGKLYSSKVINYSIPENLFSFQGYPIYNDIPEVLTNDEESSFSFNLNLKQTEFEDTYFKENIRFVVKSEIRKKDSFTIQISDYDEIVGAANKLKLEKDKSYDEYVVESEKLKQELVTLKTTYPNNKDEIDAIIFDCVNTVDNKLEQLKTIIDKKYISPEDEKEIENLSLEITTNLSRLSSEKLEIENKNQEEIAIVEENSLNDENAADNVQG